MKATYEVMKEIVRRVTIRESSRPRYFRQGRTKRGSLKRLPMAACILAGGF